jgi:glycosyltransferase involved in cell wall biosynthesis
MAYLLRDSGGAGTYARELIRGLMGEGASVVAAVGATAPPELFQEDFAADVDWVRLPVPGAGSPWHMAWELGGLSATALRKRCDVVHGLANLVPLASLRVPRVVTLLDLIWIHYPDTMDARSRFSMRTLAPLCARRADRVIAISHAAKEDMVRTIGLDAGKIDVTHLGIRDRDLAAPAGEAELRERFGLGDGPVVLCVAQKRTHKNQAGLIRALAEMERDDVRLVLPGSATPYEDELRALAGALGLGERVAFPAWVEDDELEGLYRLASCVALPSFEEGFGLPVLEAMRRGAPVACSSVSSLPEVAGDAALLFDPRDPADIARALGRLLDEPGLAADLAERGRARCAAFTWDKTARATLDVYERAFAG